MSDVSALRFEVPTDVTVFATPGMERPMFQKKVVVKNASEGQAANSLKFNLDDDTSDNYWTLGPGEVSPIFAGISGGKAINIEGIGGSVAVEILVWEE